MIEYLFSIVVPVAVAMAVAVFCDWRWPATSTRRLAVLTALFFPLLLILASVAGFFYFLSDDCPPEAICDAGAMAAVGIATLGGAWAFLSLLIGFPTALLTLRFLRQP